MPVILALYFAFCAAVGYAGRAHPLGFVGLFLLSVLLTPLATGLMLLLRRR